MLDNINLRKVFRKKDNWDNCRSVFNTVGEEDAILADMKIVL